MKKNYHKLRLLLLLAWFIPLGMVTTASAQQKLIYLWHFNNLNTGLSGAVSPSSLSSIHANWGSLDSTKATVSFVASGTVSSKYKTYWDAIAGDASDTFNVRTGAKGAAAGNNALRVRNPSDSMELRFTIPAGGYKNITIKFATERSSTTSGPGKQTFDYSTDGGTTWSTSGLSMPSDSFNNATWNYVSVSLAADAKVNNNSKLIFRIRLGAPNTGTSGNARFDNFTVEGDSINAPSPKLIHYWHFNNFTGLSKAGSPSLITPVHANWSALDSTKAIIAYVPAYTVSSKYATYWDATAGDTLNARLGWKNQTTGTNNGLRVRNPSDSMQLLFYIPTTHYSNISLKYELQYSSFGVSSSAGGRDVFDYSVDSGKTFRQSGLSITTDSMTNGSWNYVHISLGADPAVNNSNKFIFRIRTTAPNNNTKGNHRYDNVTVEGDTLIPAVNITKINTPYQQNFDSLASTGTTASAMPYGWYIYETGTNANSTYAVDSGAANGGNTYSYGHKGSTDRALGSLASGSLLPNYGVAFRNNTGSAINTLTIGYTVEEWRLGATTRGFPDSVYASMSTNATGLGKGTWTSVKALGFTSPVTSGTVGLIDGNKTASQAKVNVTLKGLNIPAGGLAWLKWSDPNVLSSDDGLAIDDFTMSGFGYRLVNIREAKFPQTAGVPDTTKYDELKGIVLGGNYASTGLSFQIKDSTGTITAISAANTFSYSPTAGDSVYIFGKVQSAGYQTFVALDSVIKIKGGYSTGAAKTVTSIANDTLESGLVRIAGMNLATGYKWDTTGNGKNGGFMTTMSNGATTYNVWIAKTTNLWGKTAPKFPMNLTGILMQNGSTATTGYYIAPRSTADLDTIKLPVYKIRQVRGQNSTTGVSDSAGNKHVFFLKGVVHSPGFTTPNMEFSLEDSTGAIIVFSSSVKNYTPSIGDSVLVRGTLTQFNGLTELTADSVKTLTKGTWLETPKTVTTLTEANEAHLVTFNNAYLVDPLTWVPAGSGFNASFTNGKDTISVRIYNNIDLFKVTTAPSGKYNITGVAGQFKSASPYIGGYQLFPRGTFDMVKIIPFTPTPLYKIRQLKGQNTSGVADSLNKGKGYIKGVVHSPGFSAASLQFSLIDSTGAITVFTSKIKYYTPSLGDSLLVKGTLTQFNGLTEYTADSIIKITAGAALKTPTVVTKMDETYESDLIKIKNVHIIDTTKWLPSGTGFNIDITNGTDTFTMRVVSAVDLFKQKVIKGNFNVTGIETQFKSASPFIGGYQIEPRAITDIEIILPPAFGLPLYKIRSLRGQNTAGVADSLNKGKGFIKGVVHSPGFSAASLQFSLLDSTGAITVFTSKIKYYTPSVGDSLLVKGTLTQFNGVTEYTADTIVKLTGGTWLKTPTVTTQMNESLESDLIKIKNVHIIDSTQWTGTGSGFNVTIVDNLKDTFVMRVVSTVDLYKKTWIKGNFNVTGIETQFKSASPFIGAYQVEPRSMADIELLASPVTPKTPLYKIRQVRGQDANGKSDSAGSKNKFFLKGIVQSPSFSLTGENFSLKDSTGAINVFNSAKVNGYTPKAGDSVQVRGVAAQFNGLTEINVDSISKLTSSNPTLTPKVITKMDESVESWLVKFNNAYIINPAQWTGTGSGFNVDVTNGKDTMQIRITNAVDLYSKPMPRGRFNVTGIASQFKSASPFIGGYQLLVRSIQDIQPVPLKMYTISQVKPIDANGAADSLNLYCMLKGVVHSSNLTGNASQFFSLADNTGAITVVAPNPVNSYSAAVGDSIWVRGTVMQNNGLIVFGMDSVSKKSGGSAKSPVTVTKLDESTESGLVMMQTWKLADPAKWDTALGIGGVMMVKAINPSNDTLTLAIMHGSGLYLNSAKPNGWFDVVGIGSQIDLTKPYLQGYVLIPRSTADITHATGIEEDALNSIAIYPNPAHDYMVVQGNIRNGYAVVTDMLGHALTAPAAVNGTARIDISTLTPGIYFIQVTQGNTTTVKKFMRN